ncbi:hypothetical protein ACG9XS_20545 [Acinetobacter gyllenbergii]|uniref:hypothetical protein n=1 Tax=Acinetobacter gyllenbergii TaxID=134534 RepID=UPI003AF57419
MATSASDRKKAERQRKKELGLIAKEVWFQPEVLSYINRFREKHPYLTFEDAVNELIMKSR